MGRKPLPTELHELQGSYEKDPQRRRNSPKAAGKPKMPTHLGKVARSEWRRVTKLLDTMGVLSQTDAPSVEQYCDAYAEWRLAKDNVDKTGQTLITKNKDGSVEVRRNPFMAVKNQAADRCVKLLAEFGLTPSSRSKLTVNSDRSDPMEDWFTKRIRNTG